MKRQVSMEEISDGKKYGLSDMVKAGCNDCKGCSACCRGMGSSIVLDPLDIHRITMQSGVTFEQLLVDKIELQVVDGMILPNLKMSGAQEQCAFLNEEGRCSIHKFRPGICRIFPLGRLYEDNSFSYFLQIHECRNENRTKVKVKKWIDTPDAVRYDKFIADWHFFLMALSEKAAGGDELTKKINVRVLQSFYMTPYTEGNFYEQYEQRKQAFIEEIEM